MPSLLSRISVLAAALLLSACTVIPITPQTIAGTYSYEGHPEGMWYGGERIVLGNGTFEYWLYTPELLAHPENSHYPIRGNYKLEGSTITFLNTTIAYPERTLTRRHKLFVMWTPKQAEDRKQLGRVPDDVLYQQ